MCTICVSEVALPWSDKVQRASASGWASLLPSQMIVIGLNGLWSDKGVLDISTPSHIPPHNSASMQRSL